MGIGQTYLLHFYLYLLFPYTMGNLVSWHPGKEPLKRQVFPIDLNLGSYFKLDFSHHLEKKNFKKYEFLAILWQIEIFKKKS